MAPEASILKSMKKLLQLPADYDHYDLDVMIHINSVFSTLHQLGVGPKDGFQITGEEEKWADFVGSDPRLNSVQSYVYAKVKLLFDPPSNAFLVTSLEKIISEFDFRLLVASEEVQNGN